MNNRTINIEIGVGDIQKEYDVDWDLSANPPTAKTRCRDFRRVACASVAGPDDILTQYGNDVRNCVLNIAKDIGAEAILKDPVAATAVLKTQALANCLGHHIEDDYAKLSIRVTVLVVAGDWQDC